MHVICVFLRAATREDGGDKHFNEKKNQRPNIISDSVKSYHNKNQMTF